MRFARSRLLLGVLTAVTTLLSACSGCLRPTRYGHPGSALPRLGDEIVVCGQLFHTGTPVVLWMDPGGYDAYRAHCRFTPEQERPSRPVSDSAARFGTFRRHLPEEVAAQVRAEGWSLPLLQRSVDLFVYHYDACGTSRRCFRVLQDLRGLSVHFMLDVDGTIYQTLDVKERAWHAGPANDRSVGIEIANIGAYTSADKLDAWYVRGEDGHTQLVFPKDFADAVWSRADYVPRPARDAVVSGEINGRRLYQYDFTDAQYDALIKLTATLCRVLPRIRPDYPRDAHGRLITHELAPEQLDAYQGLLGHYHITHAKVDPGPAFDWDRVVRGVQQTLR